MKSKSNATLSVKGNDALVKIYKPEIALELRYYNLKGNTFNESELWTDESGQQCIRYTISSKSREEESKKVLQNLQYFAADLKHHSGIEAKLDESPSSDGLHVLKINNVDYYFQSNNGGYDGWGKAIS